MDISKAVAASVRGLGLKSRSKPKTESLTAMTHAVTPEQARAQRANLRLLRAAHSDLLRTIKLLR